MQSQPSRPLRIAMWSGPRNISTAMLRSFGNRPDTAVVDEPLYAHYLKVTNLPHPGAAEVISSHESDWHKVVDVLTGPVPGGKPVFYQKHMAHHLLPDIDRQWIFRDEFVNAFLIRDPREMLTSLVRVTPEPTLADTGLPQQLELFNEVRHRTGATPVVLDSQDVLTNPRGLLSAACARFGIPFSDAMLHWPAGRRATDGVWARHWYAAVEQSTGFEKYKPKEEDLPSHLLALVSDCREIYSRLHAHRITL